MTRVVLDVVLRSKLMGLNEPLEICDETGKVLGRFVPALDPAQYEAWEPPISAEELDRRRQEPDFSTAEMVKHLESL